MTAATTCKLAFYGDDFTGSTDALEVLAFAGLRCALFLKPPSADMLAGFPPLDALGVAGDSRGMTPAEMDTSLPNVLTSLRDIGAPIVHYKVCSTFDSSPEIGNIGRVVEIARRIFPAGPVPIVAGTPALDRFCLFGHLFARSGTDGQIHRIDRHPIMSRHPVTPMTESDLRIHLRRQAPLDIASLSLPCLEQGGEAADRAWRASLAAKPDAILIDTASARHLTEVGRLLGEASRKAQRFVIGSSGAEYALTQWWKQRGEIGGSTNRYDTFPGVDRVLAVSGSASKLTAAQIAAAIDAGFIDVPLDARALIDDDRWREAARRIVDRATSELGAGRSVILHTARGPDDPRIGEMIDALVSRGQSREAAKHSGGRTLGIRLGHIVRDVLAVSPLRRVLLSGGDTSSQVTQVLAPDALEIAARLAPGAPLCRTLVRDGRGGEVEIALKGGQMGEVNFFETARAGHP